MIRTSRVKGRRTLRFGRISDIVADAEALGQAGSIRTMGNWTAAQVVDHVAEFIHLSLDGFPFKAPVVLRVLGMLFRSAALIRPWRPGLKVPRRFAALKPDPSVTWEQALARLRVVAARIDAGERMEQRSPVLGDLAHEEWIQLHCRHAELHFSFLERGEGAEERRSEGESESKKGMEQGASA